MKKSLEKYIDKFWAMVFSRRFQMAVLAVLVILFQDTLGVPDDKAQWLAGILMTWAGLDAWRKTE